MKTWSIMYALIWAAFFQIIIILFPIFGISVAIDLHVAVGVIVVFLAIYSFLSVKKTMCPERIKRISKTTAILGGIQGALGLILLGLIRFNASSTLQEIVIFLHAVNALAIITQAASSATSFDMWQEKEFLPASATT
jgi:hypothetical protein